MTSPTSTATLPVSLMVHLANQGDRYFSGEFAGSRGASTAVEAIRITSVPVPNVSILLQVHAAGLGDGPWVNQYDLAGSTGQSRRLEGFSARLTGPDASLYDIKYTAHLQDHGDVGPSINGQYCGTKGVSKRLEGLKMWLEPKGTPLVFLAMRMNGTAYY